MKEQTWEGVDFSGEVLHSKITEELRVYYFETSIQELCIMSPFSIIGYTEDEQTLRPLCTPSSVGCTYRGHDSSINLAKQKNASSSEGIVYRNGAASTFIP